MMMIIIIMMMMMMKCFKSCRLLLPLLMLMMMMITTSSSSSIQYDTYNKQISLSYTRKYSLPRIEASIYEQYNPMKDNMSNWRVVSRASTPSFICRETWREFTDIRYNLSIQHGSYEGYYFM
jgi:hypothetical protein